MIQYLRPVEDPAKLEQICDFINDLIADTDVRGQAEGTGITWLRLFSENRKYQIDQNDAFYRLTRAGYNPKQLVEFAQSKFDPQGNENEEQEA